MYGKYQNIKICGIAAIAPENVVDNRVEAEKFGSKRAVRQIMLTGIRRRHCMKKGQKASDLCCAGAERLFEKLGWNRNEIRVLVYVTQWPDVRTPSTAMIIQKRLGIGQDCIAFDVNLGCSGYTSGLQIVAALLQNTGGKGLLLAGDGGYRKESATTDSLLFGGGGSATAIELEDGNPLLYAQKTDGTRYELLTTGLNGKTKMDGNGILLFSLNEVSQSICDCKNYFNVSEDMIDYYVLHQAQKIILDGIRQACDIDDSKILRSYEEYGNTTTASIPLTICNDMEKIREKERVKLYLCGYGNGLAWSSVILDLDTKNILPLELLDYND